MRLGLGLVLSVAMVAFEGLAVTTIVPVATSDLQSSALYGWAFSGFMLGAILGVIAAGECADRFGLPLPFGAALAQYSVGVLICGLAPTMLVFIVGRAVEGLGTGATRSLVWLSLGRDFPREAQPRMGAYLSSAWIVPSLVGPSLAGLMVLAWSWRFVFLALLPLVPCVAWLLPMLVRANAGHQPVPISGRRLGNAVVLAMGVGLCLVGVGSGAPLPTAGWLLAGLALAGPALRRSLPAGTLAFRHGLPAALGLRGLLTFTFSGAQAFLPLALEEVRGLSPTLTGVVVSVGSLGWTSGSWTVTHFDRRLGVAGRASSSSACSCSPAASPARR